MHKAEILGFNAHLHFKVMQFIELKLECTSMRYRASWGRAMQGCFGFNFKHVGKSI
jgi:hypothetical protein